MLTRNISLNDNRIRREFFNDEWYYSLVDFVAIVMDVDPRTAKNYYHVLKMRLKTDKRTLPTIKQLKALTRNNKMYLTDFTNFEGLLLMRHYIEEKRDFTKRRIAKTNRDELSLLQPSVIDKLLARGWQVEHHVRLSSGHIIDMVATYDDKKYIIECKVRLDKFNLYRAIGQVLCYLYEYDKNAIPVIASYSSEFNNYTRQSLISLGIEMLEI